MNNSLQFATIISSVQLGQLKKFVPHEKGGWYLVLSPAGRFRADASLFGTPPVIGSLISFLPDENTINQPKARIKRVREILFQPTEE